MIRLQIMGETPSKKNSKILTRTGKLIPGKKYQEWHKDAMQQIQSQALMQARDIFGTVPLNCELKIKLTFYHGDLRRRDSDNGTSSIFDLLTDCGILADDCWTIVREFSVDNKYEKNLARCIIEIERL